SADSRLRPAHAVRRRDHQRAAASGQPRRNQRVAEGHTGADHARGSYARVARGPAALSAIGHVRGSCGQSRPSASATRAPRAAAAHHAATTGRWTLKWLAIPGESVEMFPPVGQRLVDDFTGEAPIGAIVARLDHKVGAGFIPTDIRALVTS